MLQCASCGYENPEVNRFCGMCGSILERRRKAPAMVVQFPRGEQSAAQTGTPEASTSVAGESLEHPAERAPQRHGDNRVEVTDAPVPGEFNPRFAEEPPPTTEQQQTESRFAVERERDVMHAGGNSTSIFGDLTPAESGATIGGPSILGIGDDSDAVFLQEEEDRHTGRKLLLTMFLILVAVLLALQWRSNGFNGNFRAMLGALLNRPSAESPQNSAATSQTASAQKPQSDQAAPEAKAPEAEVKTPESEAKPPQAAAEHAAEQKTGDTADSKGAQPSEQKAAASNEKPAEPSESKSAAPAEPKQKPEDATEQQAAEDVKPAKKPPAVIVTPKPAEAPGARQYARAQAELSAHNCEQALVYFRAAANVGYSAAASKLGAMYATGNCAPQDRAEAYHWISQAASQEPSNSWLARNRDMLWSQMTPQERARAR